MRTRSFPVILLLATLALVNSRPAHAVAGPPLVSDDPGTPGPNNWEINIAYTSETSSEDKRVELPLLDINYGLGEKIQLKYQVPYVISKNEEQDTKHSGFDRSQAGVKWRFRDKKKTEGEAKPEGIEKVEGSEEGGVALSTYPQYTFKSPVSETARNADAPTTHEFFLPIEAEETVGKWDFNEELGYNWLEADTSQIAGGLALTYTIKEDAAQVLGEIHAQFPVNFRDREVLADIGTILAINKFSNFLFSIGRTFQTLGSDPNRTLIYAALQLHL